MLAERAGYFFNPPHFSVGAIEILRFHFDKIDDAFVIRFEADGNLHHDRVVL